ncbi:MAG: hypothetical protein JWQ08_701, partial [Deinococcus sp.]|nr:hypothetical protein [Deinococcus sp.]
MEPPKVSFFGGVIRRTALSASARQTLVRLQVRYGRGNVSHARAFADLRPELRPGRFI